MQIISVNTIFTTILDPDFLTQIWAQVCEIVKETETESKELPSAKNWTSEQKYSRAAFLFEKAYKLLDIFFKFPDYVDKVFENLPKLIKMAVELFHSFEIFTHKNKPAIS